MQNTIRVLITGAAGQISYSLIFRIASGQMFGLQTNIEMHLFELDKAMLKLEGIVKELEDCSFPLLKKILATSNIKDAVNGVNWAILLGSYPRNIEMSRFDLLRINGNIFIEQGKAINNYAAQNIKIFVVGNPCNTNCLIAMHHASDIPKDRFYAMTSLDELRAKFQLAKKANVSTKLVTKMIIWGNHSPTQYPDFYHAKINDIPANDVIHDEYWLKKVFVPLIRNRGEEIIKIRKSSSAGSAANAIIYGINCLYSNTTKCFSIACHSNGEYGIDKGLIFSFPCYYKNGTFKILENLTFNEYGKLQLHNTLQELRNEKNRVQFLNLI